MREIIQSGLGCFLAAAGFGILFNIRGKKVIVAGFCAGVGGIIYQVCENMGYSELSCYFLAGLSFSMLSEVCARFCHTPVSTFIAPSLIPFVPGGTMYYMMTAIVKSESTVALNYFMETMSIAGLLALDILIAHTLAKLIHYLRAHMPDHLP